MLDDQRDGIDLLSGSLEKFFIIKLCHRAIRKTFVPAEFEECIAQKIAHDSRSAVIVAAMQDPTDPLSALGRQILKLEPNAYARLVVAGTGSVAAKELLSSATPSGLIVGMQKNIDDAKAMLAGLWLWHDWLDESHKVSQNLETPSGSFWHAIMHRREGDFSNSKYWYARCANHPALATLAVQAAAMINPYPADKSLLRIVRDGFDPNAFVDLVQHVHERTDDPHHRLAVELQRLEWRVLFEHCTRAAAAG
jgi:hypothetical protein